MWVLLLLAAVTEAYGAILGNVRGIVHDPDHRPVPDAQVTIRAAASDWSLKTRTNADGEFSFPAVAIGAYRVTAEREGFSPAEQTFVLGSSGAPILHLQLQLAVMSQKVEATEVADAVSPESAASETLLSRRQIERTPGGDRTNSLAAITNNVPGAYVVHDQLHIRGGHQVTWLIDGVPVPNTNIASNVGPQFDPKDADYIEVQRGGYSAEYGDHTYAVFNVVPRTGFERNNEGELVASYGSFHQSNAQISFGSHTQTFAWYGSVNGNRTDLGLATPGPEVLHDRSGGLGAFGTLVWNADKDNQLRLVSSARRDRYQVPNDPDQQAAGLDFIENERDAFVNLSFTHTSGPGVLWSVSPFYHFNRAEYAGGTAGPVEDRASTYAGAQAAVSATSRTHNARAGIYGFAQRDTDLFGIGAIRERQTLSGHLEALFLEDQYKPAHWLTLTGGVRLTHFSGTLAENAASPRAGAALHIPHVPITLRGYYGRFYQAPPLATVSGPLLELAAGQGFGFLPLRGERDEQVQFGATIPFRGWNVDVDRFRTHARNYFDHNVLGNSNIFLPVTVERAQIRGWEVALRSPRIFRRGWVRVAWSRQVAEGAGAVTGGLTGFEPAGGVFLLDHDQRHTLNVGGDVNLPLNIWIAANVYYGSGFADNGGPAHLPGHTSLDATVGKALGACCSVSLTALNAANRRFLADNSLTFGGTHYADPRQIYAQLRYRFRF